MNLIIAINNAQMIIKKKEIKEEMKWNGEKEILVLSR